VETHIKRDKNVQKHKVQTPFYTSPKREAQSPEESGRMSQKPKQPKHLNRIPTWSSPGLASSPPCEGDAEMGQAWCGRTRGAGAWPLASLGPTLHKRCNECS
jgi:hypothetical protein